MRRVFPAVLTAIVLVTIPALGLAQGKVTKDPNATARAAAKAPKPDPRLDQKITYDSGAKRLHDVVDDLARMSGVNILSGKSKDDWRVKDIPLVVCVKDMPLGKLLTAIADATHTHLGSEVIGKNDPKKSYRIYRRYVDEAAIDDYMTKRHEAFLAQAKWQWDAAVAYGKAQELPGVGRRVWLVARLMASFGSGAWDRLANGETLRITIRDTATESMFRDLYQQIWDEESKSDGANARTPTSEDMNVAVFKVKLTDSGFGSAHIEPYFGPVRLGERHFTHDSTPVNPDILKQKGFPVPPYPESPKTPSREDDMGNPDMVFLLNYADRWNRPLLTAKLDLEKPKDIKEPGFADLIRELAKAGGCNIVTEDFYSHRGATYNWDAPVLPADVFRKDTSLAETLKLRGNGVPNVWFFNESQKLLIGWCSWWREPHWNLVPEEFVDRLREKYKTTGIELDDAVHAWCLPSSSFSDWIIAYKELRCFEKAWFEKDPMWRLYDALEPSDKLLARSKDGLNLGKFEASWVMSFAADQKKRQYLQPETPSVAEDMTTNEWDKERKLVDELATYRDKALADPKAIASMVIHANESSPKYRLKPEGPDYNIPAALKLKSYEMVINYKMDGEDHSVNVGGPNITFPILSPEREAEIIKAAKDAQTKAGSKANE